jgi:hypothetical protein
LIDGNIDGRLKVAGGKLIRVPRINQIDALRIIFYYFFKGRKVNGSFFSTGFNLNSCRSCTVSLFPGRVTGVKNFSICISKLNRLPGGLMAQLSGVALAVKNYQRTLIGRQFTLEYVKLAVRNADGRGNMAFVVFWFQRPGIHQDHLVCCNLLGHIGH